MVMNGYGFLGYEYIHFSLVHFNISLSIYTFLYNNVLIFYYEQPKSFGLIKSITDVNLFITTKGFKYLRGNKN